MKEQLTGMLLGILKNLKKILEIGGYIEFDYYGGAKWGCGESLSYRCMKSNENGTIDYSEWVILDDWVNPVQSASSSARHEVHHRIDLDVLGEYDSLEFRISRYVTRVGHTTAGMDIYLRNFKLIEK